MANFNIVAPNQEKFVELEKKMDELFSRIQIDAPLIVQEQTNGIHIRNSWYTDAAITGIIIRNADGMSFDYTPERLGIGYKQDTYIIHLNNKKE